MKTHDPLTFQQSLLQLLEAHPPREDQFLAEFGLEARLSASLGLSLYPDHGKEPQELMQKADQAMYSVKVRGKDAVCVAK